MYPTKEPDEKEKTQAQEIMHIVNNICLDEKGLVAALARDHRTLQQSFTRIMVEWIEYLANLDDGEYDLRNYASVRLAKQLVATPQWGDLKYLPYI